MKIKLMVLFFLGTAFAQVPAKNENIKTANLSNVTNENSVIVAEEANNLIGLKPINKIKGAIDFLPTFLIEVNNKRSDFENHYTIICDGDSRTAGYTGTIFYKYSEHLDLGSSYTVHNTAIGGATFTDNEIEGVRWLTKDAYNVVTPLKSVNSTNNIVVIWAGFNDVAVRDRSPQETFESLKEYCIARKNEGFKVIVVTEPSTTSVVGEQRRLVLNSLVRNSFYEYADRIVDLEQNEYIGPTGTAFDAAYFYDGVHMTKEGYSQVGALVRAAIVNIISLSKVEFESDKNVKLFPNPSNNFIQINGLTKRENYVIYNILGIQMSNGEVLDNETINIQNIAKGLCFLKLGDEYSIKFIKE